MSKKRRKGTYQTGGSNKRRDKMVRAKTPGKRKSAGGSIYYERRRNRSDMPGKLLGVKLIKLPKRPKRSASTAQMEKYVDLVRSIKKENERRISLAKTIKKLTGK